MGYSVVISERAQKDILLIYEYLISQWTENDVLIFSNKLDNLLSQLSTKPYLYLLFNKSKNIYRVPVTKHNMLYYRIREKSKRVDILRVFNVFQSPDKLKL